MITGLLALALCAAPPAPPAKEKKVQMREFISYTESLPIWGTSLMLFVSPHEESSFINTGPLPEAPGLGIYSRRLPEDDARAVCKLVERTDLAALMTNDPMPPETPSISLGHGDLDGPLDKQPFFGFPIPKLPDEVVTIRARMRKLIPELVGHPLHTIRGAARPRVDTIKTRSALEIDLDLESFGREAVEFVSPDSTARVILTIGPDKPADKVDEEKEVQSVELDAKERFRIDDKGKRMPTSETLRLASKETAHFRLKKKVYLSPGRYKVAVTVRFDDPDNRQQPFISGVLVVDAGHFTVRGWW